MERELCVEKAVTLKKVSKNITALQAQALMRRLLQWAGPGTALLGARQVCLTCTTKSRTASVTDKGLHHPAGNHSRSDQTLRTAVTAATSPLLPFSYRCPAHWAQSWTLNHKHSQHSMYRWVQCHRVGTCVTLTAQTPDFTEPLARRSPLDPHALSSFPRHHLLRPSSPRGHCPSLVARALGAAP